MNQIMEKKIEVGDVMLGTYGYEARYPEFYKVTKISGEWAYLQPLKKVFVSRSGNYSGDVSWYTTNGEASEAKAFRRKIKYSTYIQYGEDQYSPYVRISSYEYAYKWDGSDQDQYNYH